MLRVGGTETVLSDVGSGDADDSPSWAFDNGDAGGPFLVDGCANSAGDNLSMDVDAIFAILDGEPPDSTNDQDNFQDKQVQGSILLEKASLHQDDDTSSGISSTSNWLSLSTLGHRNQPMGSVVCSPSISGTFENPQFQALSPDTLKSSRMSACKSAYGSQVAELAKRRQDSELGYGDPLGASIVACENKMLIESSDNFYRDHATDSSHLLSLETYGFDGFHDNGYTHFTLNTGRLEDNTDQLVVASSNGQDAKSPSMPSIHFDKGSYSIDMLNVELNNDCATEMPWNTWPSLSVPVGSHPHIYPEAAKDVLKNFPCQLSQPFLSCDNQNLVNGKAKEEVQEDVHSSRCPGNEMKTLLQLEDTSFIDSDSSLSGMSCNGKDHVASTNSHFASNADSFNMSFHQNYPNKDSRRHVDASKMPPYDSLLFNSKKRKLYTENVSSQEHCYLQNGVEPLPPKVLPGYTTYVDEDHDICIIDDRSYTGHPSHSVVPKKQGTQPDYGFSDPYYPRASSSRFHAADEKLTFQIALQDLAQPKSEARPPEGVLAVPLLRHQRIALSWMVQKETSSLHCSGGILADDQGLGKTISTIALIVTERSPSSKSSTTPAKEEVEALNLDDDDDLPKSSDPKKGNSNAQMTGGLVKNENASRQQRGRPAAGTLVVCPTSVLRQWADELRSKVTGETNLSFLVYHGSNRTRDPYELVKYDVVLTTYSIVSMEVPTRSAVEKVDGKGKPGVMIGNLDSSVVKKRKDAPRKFKDSDIADSLPTESTARPLARVGWFRVILDEAQTIKNHRTQVARACWGLRAKRRWCLSGTPIQNAVDDLYSYFRFLRYEPFSVYHSFCSKIKVPINREPAVGYRKLQAVLKTIMLRRTKGTLLDGKPIINLPPKKIMLKKVDFSDEERAFYARLEAESREKFKGYADAGTVKQNYVNILLMLLRLRQACDHPLLVKGSDSLSILGSSLEAAKRIQRDKQVELLNSLKACLALCTSCNDPPEDAVIAICGHIYCNQCISEHLTGDDNYCLSANCKVKLTGASVFSRATLESSLGGFSQHGCQELPDTTEVLDANMPADSSKIKAAVEILQSLRSYDSGSHSNYLMDHGECTAPTKNICGAGSEVNLDDNVNTIDQTYAKCSKGLVSEKAIVYSQWTRMLDLLEARLKSLSIQYRRLDGTMTIVARDKAVKDFNTLPEVTVMIMSLKAASLGLNMVSACHVLLLDLWWNPTTEDQAIDRAHRIGQTRPVTVSRLTIENTVEDRILALQEKKREMVASAFGEDESGGHQTRLTVEDLRYLFRM